MTNQDIEDVRKNATSLIDDVRADMVNESRTARFWMQRTIDMANAVLALCTEVEQTEQRTREQVAADLRVVDGFEWALAGQQAGNDAAQIALGER